MENAFTKTFKERISNSRKQHLILPKLSNLQTKKITTFLKPLNKKVEMGVVVGLVFRAKPMLDRTDVASGG